MEVETYNSFKDDMDEIKLKNLNQITEQIALLGLKMLQFEERIRKLEKE